MDSITTAPAQIHSPESDGKPMGETNVHIATLIYLREALVSRRLAEPGLAGC
jgi:hypothetical protein